MQEYFSGLLQIQKLDVHHGGLLAPINLGIVHSNKGESVYLNTGKQINAVCIIELVPGLPARGNHYHQWRQEIVYIMQGKIRSFFWLPGQLGEQEIILEKGDLITIQPKLAHAYQAIERSWGLELASHSFSADEVIADIRIK